jgi:methionyl-tRNA formyltransferase
MKKISEPIVFFGSGPVAAASLELLLQDFEIEAVVTKPRPAHHKGAVPVLELAQKHQLNTFTVASRSELNTLIYTRPVRSRVAVLIDFGIIVSQEVIDYFELGIINSHFSLLPEWRGADPITFSILSGQSRTGISLMLLSAGMDEGPLLAQADFELHADETTPSLTEALIELSHKALQTILPEYIAGSVIPQPQEAVTIAASPEPTYSRKLSKQDGMIDLTKKAVELERQIRAFVGWPGSRLTLGGIEVIVTQASVVTAQPDPPSPLVLQTSDKYLRIERLKPVGKKEMSAEEFLRGYGSRL